MRLSHSLLSVLLFKHLAQAASYSPTLDITNQPQLLQATKQALTNLISYYKPAQDGAFSQVQTPWHESGMIWGMYMDYTKWSGDTQFLSVVIGALVNASYVTEHDFLGGSAVSVVQTFLGRWNDDILWYSQASVGGAEIFGPKSIMAGSNGDWISLASKTFDQAAAESDDKCGGGIYWSRDRGSPSGVYKSLITELEFVAQGARNYIQNQNETALTQTKQIMDWVISSGLGNPQTGMLLDGVATTDCTKFTKLLWSYNYGQLLGALAWMHKATNDQKYLDMTVPFFEFALNTFAGDRSSGVISELCEANTTCNRDQQGFKAVFARNLVYLYRQTNNETMKTSIRTIINTSVQAMVSRSCDQQWNCGGNWTTDTQPIKYVRSQHVSAALLVSAIGIYNDPSSGLLPKVDVSTFNANLNVNTTATTGARKNSGHSDLRIASLEIYSITLFALGLMTLTLV